MGVITKKCPFPVKYRIIHDLSWPPQDLVNNHIDPDALRCFYGSFDHAVALIIKHGVGAMSAKLDLADASKDILVRSQDWPLFVLILGPPATRWIFFFPLGCTDLQLCSMNTLMPCNMPCKSTKCRICYTTWMITLLLVYQTTQFVPTTLPPSLLCVGSLASLSILKGHKTHHNHKFPWSRH